MPSNPTDKLGISTPNLAHALARRVWRNRDYEPAFMWWELVVLWRQLFLVGFALLIMAGTVEQLACSFLVALVYMLILSVASPFKEDGDDYFGQACSFSLTAVYFFMFVIKIDLLTNSVDYVLSDQLRDTYKLDIFIVTIGMIGSILLALFLVVVIAAQQILQAARVPTIRFARTKATLDLPLAMGQLWHLFLSHIWGTGQDQCATIKRQLKILVPSASVFLDVDDLQSTDALEKYIVQSAMIMIFVSKGYFFSRSKRPHMPVHLHFGGLLTRLVCVPCRLPPRGASHRGSKEALVSYDRPSARRRAAPRPRGRVSCAPPASNLWATYGQAQHHRLAPCQGCAHVHA